MTAALLPAFAQRTDEGLVLRLKVVPGASRSQLAGVLGDRLKLRIAAPPEAGKANAAVLVLLGQWLGCKDPRLLTGLASAEKMHCVASSRGAIDADPAPGAIAPRVEETGVGHGPG
jgi:uncharacterized protein (TIGR00251 family)